MSKFIYFPSFSAGAMGSSLAKNVKLKNFYKRSITKNIRETLIDIQNENIKDPFGWVLPLE